MIRCSECGRWCFGEDLTYGMCAACAKPRGEDPYETEHDCRIDWAAVLEAMQQAQRYGRVRDAIQRGNKENE